MQKYCRHSKGEWAGRPLILDPNHKQLVEDIWGWRRESDGTRLYREVFEAIPRKNGKSTIASAIGLALTVGDGEPGAEVYSIAGSKAQASMVFAEARRMVHQSAELSRDCDNLVSMIYCAKLDSRFQPLGSKPSTQHGYNVHGRIGDGLHAWTSREQYDVMTTAEGTRRQPLGFDITTAGDNPQSLCGELWDHALKVRDGIHLDPSFLPVIFAADKDDDPSDPATWAKANPNLGVSIKLDYLERKFRKAESQPSFMSAFKRLHLNIWVESHDKWMPIAVWNDPANAASFNEADLIGRPCWMGLDLAWKHDITALMVVFPPIEADPRWYIVSRFFLPEQNIIQRSKRDRVPYDVWAEKGLLTLTPGDITDFDIVEEHIRALWDKFKPRAMGFDRVFAGPTVNSLTNDGYDCVAVGQGFMSTALPMAELDRAVNGRILRHGGNPILAWMASNLVVETDKSGNLRPDKKRSIQRIDGIPATLNAMALALAAKAEPASPYERRGLLILR